MGRVKRRDSVSVMEHTPLADDQCGRFSLDAASRVGCAQHAHTALHCAKRRAAVVVGAATTASPALEAAPHQLCACEQLWRTVCTSERATLLPMMMMEVCLVVQEAKTPEMISVKGSSLFSLSHLARGRGRSLRLLRLCSSLLDSFLHSLSRCSHSSSSGLCCSCCIGSVRLAEEESAEHDGACCRCLSTQLL